MASFNGDGKAIFIVFVGAIIAATLIVGIANQVTGVTTLFQANNVTYTAPTLNFSEGGFTALEGRQHTNGTQIVSNATGAITSGPVQNFTLVSERSPTSGLQTVMLIMNTSTHANGTDVNVTYEYQPDGYIRESGGRSITLLIVIFSALAVLIFVIVVFVKEGSMGKLIRGS